MEIDTDTRPTPSTAFGFGLSACSRMKSFAHWKLANKLIFLLWTKVIITLPFVFLIFKPFAYRI